MIRPWRLEKVDQTRTATRMKKRFIYFVMEKRTEMSCTIKRPQAALRTLWFDPCSTGITHVFAFFGIYHYLYLVICNLYNFIHS